MDSSQFLKDLYCKRETGHGTILKKVMERKEREFYEDRILWWRRGDYREEVQIYRDGAPGDLGRGSSGVYRGDEEEILGRQT